MLVLIRKYVTLFFVISVFAFLSLSGGCASVPKEAVQLSYLVGEDLQQLHSSYRALARLHFQDLRRQATGFLEMKWKPAYIEAFVETGKLAEKARGSDPSEVLEDVQLWAEVALEEIENKRKELIGPIDEDERMLLEYIDESFSRVIRANAVVTAHLSSVRDIEEVQTQVLESMNLRELRNKINQGLIDASNRSEKAIKALEQSMENL